MGRSQPAPGPAFSVGLAFLSLLVVAGGVAAASNAGQASFTYAGSSQYDGVQAASCPAYLLDPRPPGPAGTALSYMQAQLIVVETRLVDRAGTPSPYQNELTAGPQQRTQREVHGPLRVGWNDRDGDALWRMYGLTGTEVPMDGRGLDVRLHASTLYADGFAPHAEWTDLTTWDTGTDLNAHALPLQSGTLPEARRVWAPDLLADLGGAGTLYLRDGWVEDDSGRYDVGPYRQTMDGTTHTYREAFLHVDGLSAQGLGVRGVHCAALNVALDGRMAADTAQGTYESEGASTVLDDGRLTLYGRLEVNEAFRRQGWDGPGSSAADARGDFEQLGVDTRRVATGPVAPALAAWSLAGALGAALAVLLWRVPDMAAFWLRVRGQSALDHPRRRLLLDAIRGRPGSDLRDLTRMTGMAAGVLRHHLRVLHHSRHVEGFRHGRSYRLVPIDGSRQERRTRVLQALDPRYAFLLEATGPVGATQARLEEALAERFHVARRSARKIIHGAEAHGLLVRERTAQGVMVRCPPIG